jgi:hypothetical protein
VMAAAPLGRAADATTPRHPGIPGAAPFWRNATDCW